MKSIIHIKNHRQKDLFDPWRFLSPKRRDLLDQSWAGLFQKELLCEFPVGEVASFFNDDFGRPTKELHIVLGALILQHCCTCPFQGICPVKQGKKYHYLHYTDKEMRLAIRRAYEQTEEFKNPYRWRSGVEATMSEYDRRTGVKHLRVRGFKAVRFCATLKAVGVNIFRAAAVRKAVNNLKAAHGGVLPALMHAI